MTMTPGATAPVRLADIVSGLGGELHGDDQRVITRIASLESADETSLSFLAQARFKPAAAGHPRGLRAGSGRHAAAGA